MVNNELQLTREGGIVEDAPEWKLSDMATETGARQFPAQAEVWLIARVQGGNWIAPFAFRSLEIAERAAALFGQALALQNEEPPADCEHPESERIGIFTARADPAKTIICRLCGETVGLESSA